MIYQKSTIIASSPMSGPEETNGRTSREWPAVPGPKDRESFFTAQHRHRRATWRISVLCLLAVLFMGIPLSIVTAPLAWTTVILATDLVNIAIPAPDLFAPLVALLDTIINGENGQAVFRQHLPILLLVSLGSGSLAFLLLWLSVRGLVFRSGTAGILARLGAREPDMRDLEEKQLSNIIGEMAIAAGLPVPRLLLFDGEVANAAALGVSIDDTTILVSRRLLDDCDRDQTQAVIAHLIGSAGNGDLRISMVITSVFLVLGMALTLLNTSASRASRRLFGRLLRASLKPGRSPQEEMELIAALLQAESAEIDDKDSEGLLNQFRTVLRLPFLLLYMSFLVSKSMFQLFILGPSLSLFWRTRKYLADATAVQLTRNPAGLAHALEHLSEHGGLVPGGQYTSHLFIVGSEIQQARRQQHYQDRMNELRQQNQGKSWGERIGTMGQAYRASQCNAEEMRKDAGNSGENNLGIPFSMLPPLAQRLQRLARMGVDIDSGKHVPESSRSLWKWAAYAAGIVVIGPIMGMMLMLIYSIMALSTMLGLGASMGLMMILVSILHPLLRLL